MVQTGGLTPAYDVYDWVSFIYDDEIKEGWIYKVNV